MQLFGTEFYPPLVQPKQLIINDLYSFVTGFLPFSGCKSTKKSLKTMKMSELYVVGLAMTTTLSSNKVCPQDSSLG